jgi:hypothetical protein
MSNPQTTERSRRTPLDTIDPFRDHVVIHNAEHSNTRVGDVHKLVYVDTIMLFICAAVFKLLPICSYRKCLSPLHLSASLSCAI